VQVQVQAQAQAQGRVRVRVRVRVRAQAPAQARVPVRAQAQVLAQALAQARVPELVLGLARASTLAFYAPAWWRCRLTSPPKFQVRFLLHTLQPSESQRTRWLPSRIGAVLSASNGFSPRDRQPSLLRLANCLVWNADLVLQAISRHTESVACRVVKLIHDVLFGCSAKR